MKEFVKASGILMVGLFMSSVLFADEAPRFHVNAAVDGLGDPAQYVGGGVVAVTEDLGAPSAVWDHVGDNSMIDYIYVGESTVATFYVARDGKQVNEAVSDSRSNWEAGVCPGYSDCPAPM